MPLWDRRWQTHRVSVAWRRTEGRLIFFFKQKTAYEISCKAGQGKSICAFPDVCFTPPQTPATPPGVPIPYPNTGMDSDTTDGSKTVQISGQEVMLKNKSYFKKSTGDEAGCAPKKGVVTSKNMGKVYFNAWSMDVKFEGENVVRNLDITTHNHA